LIPHPIENPEGFEKARGERATNKEKA
jgi:hypothetical protein